MSFSKKDIFNTFTEAAQQTHQLITDGLSNRLLILEETLTDLNLIQIANKHKDYIYTRKFNRKEEGSKSGADWLWFIGEPGSWLPILIQAKIINPETGTCQYLNYKKGKQRSLLLEYSRRHSFLPYYCVYSSISKKFVAKNRSLKIFQGLENEQWGCTLYSPQSVKKKIQNHKTGQEILNTGIPWAFPFRSTKKKSYDKLSIHVAKSLNKIRHKLAEKFPEDNSINSDRNRINWQNRNPEEMVKEQIPKFIMRFLNGKENPTKAPVANIGIISCVPVQSVLAKHKSLPAPQRDLFIDQSMLNRNRKNHKLN